MKKASFYEAFLNCDISLPVDLGEGVEVNSGKFGPYIKCGGKSVSLRGNDIIFNINLERAKADKTKKFTRFFR